MIFGRTRLATIIALCISLCPWQPNTKKFILRPQCGCVIVIPYPRKRGPMGGAPYTGPRLGDGPIFEVSVAHLDARECPGKLPTLSS